MVDRLPRTSQFRHEYSQDDEVAEAWAEVDEDDRPVPDIPLTEWSPEAERLSDIVDLLGEHIAVLVAVNSKDGKVKSPPAARRPKTALDRVAASAEDRSYEELMALIGKN